MKTFTYADLKKAISQLTDEQLTKDVLLFREHETLSILSLDITKHDFYYNINDFEDCGSLEELKEVHGEDFNMADYRFGTAKDIPFLVETIN